MRAESKLAIKLLKHCRDGFSATMVETFFRHFFSCMYKLLNGRLRLVNHLLNARTFTPAGQTAITISITFITLENMPKMKT